MAVEVKTPRVDLQVPNDMKAVWTTANDGIVKYPEEVLRDVAKPVTKPTTATRELIDRMKKAMLDAHGVGLAAPQVGVSERIIVYKLPEENQPIRVIINPKIISRKGEQVGPEGCLSMPMLQGDVKRANEIIVKGMDVLGRPMKRRATEYEARVIQHEVDHLDGVLFIDRADPETLFWQIGAEDDSGEPAAVD